MRGSDEPIDSRPQLIFVALVAALLVYAIASSLQRSPLAAMFPVIIGIATLLACLYVGGVLAFGPPGSRLNFDAEQSAGTAKRSAIPMNLAWIAGFIAATALGGFIIATAAYLVLFLKLRAGAGIVKALTMALVASLVLWGTESLVVVELPRGLLQFLWGSGL